MKRAVIISLQLSLLLSALPPPSIFAAGFIPPGPGESGGFPIGEFFQPVLLGRFNTFGDLATVVITILTGLAAILSVFFIILGGLKFVTAAGDEKKMASARDTITYAIIGIVVTALAFVILQIVQYFFGADVKTI